METLIEETVRTNNGRVIVRDGGPCFYGKQFPRHDAWRIPYLAEFTYRNLLVSVSNVWEPVYPNVEEKVEETPDEIRVPAEIYFASLYPYGKAAKVLTGVLGALGNVARGASIFSSSPRFLLGKIHNDECRDWQREVGSEGFRQWMLYSLANRLSAGSKSAETRARAAFVLSTLSSGPNIDIKVPVGQFGPDIYDALMEYFEELHGESITRIDPGNENEEVMAEESSTTYFLKPHDGSWNETGISFPARGRSEKYNAYDVQVRPKGAQSVVKISSTPIPNNSQHMRVVTVEFGYYLPSASTSSLPEPTAVTMRMHISHTTKEGMDLRDNEHSTSWQKITKGKIKEGAIHIQKEAVRAWQKPIELAGTLFEDKTFGILETFRAIRAHLTRYDTTQHEMLASIKGLTMSEAVGDAVPGGYFLEKNREIIESGVTQILTNPPEIDEQLRKEILSDIATSSLVSPLGFIEIIRRSKAYKLFKGMSEIDDADLDQISHELYKRLGKAYGYTDPKNEPYPDDSSTAGERWWVDDFYKQYTPHPQINTYGEKDSDNFISWSTDPDGISEIVRAVEKVRIKKRLPVLPREVSLISRFCEYFDFVF